MSTAFLRAISLCVLALGAAFAAAVVLAGASIEERALARVRGTHLGLPPIPLPEDNPPTPEKIALGRRLFFDRRLSVNNTMSCGLCHIPEQGFTNNELATPVGVEGRAVRRNAPTIVNAAFAPAVFQDGRGTSLETQVFDPLLARNEMANPSVNHLVDKIRRLEDYDGLFEAAFGGGPTGERIGMAIASWERTMVAGDSPFDRWKYGGNERALTAEQKRGFELFSGKAMCITCHPVGESAALFTDDRFHDTGIGYFSHEVGPIDEAPVPVEVAPGVVIPVDKGFMKTISEETELDFGRFEVTKDPSDKWRFRTPSLRNVALTAPYMHDGSLRTLEDVVRFYVRGGIRHDGLDPLIRPLDLTDDEVSALVEFLQGLTSADVDVLVEDARSVPIGN